MIFVGIDVAKTKHDCAILDEDNKLLTPIFSFANNSKGFSSFYEKVICFEQDLGKIKVGLEATGHYSDNIISFLLEKEFNLFVLNPLHTSLFKKSLSLRKTKTDKVDANVIALMLMSELNLKPYSRTSYHISELKSLTRYRSRKVQERALLRTSISRLVNILFPEIETVFSSVHTATAYTLLKTFASIEQLSKTSITRLTRIVEAASKNQCGRQKAEEVKRLAKNTVGIHSAVKFLELKHTIILVEMLSEEIKEIETLVAEKLDALDSNIMSIPGIGYGTGAAIIAEIGDFSKFDSPNKILAYAGMSPSIYQSGKLYSSHAKMEKRGSKYLRSALYNASKNVINNDEVFKSYYAKKRAEGKHYNVALSHVAKKLVRIIFHIETTGEKYQLIN